MSESYERRGYDMEYEQKFFEWLNSDPGYIKEIMDEYRAAHETVPEDELIQYVYKELLQKTPELVQKSREVKGAIKNFYFFNK